MLADRDLVIQDFSLVLVPGMRLGVLGARWGVACGASRAPERRRSGRLDCWVRGVRRLERTGRRG